MDLKVVNPHSGKKVSAHGKLGRSLIRHGHVSHVENPITGRKVQLGGRAANEALFQTMQSGGALSAEERALIQKHNIKAKFNRNLARIPERYRANYGTLESRLPDSARSATIAEHIEDLKADQKLMRRAAEFPERDSTDE